MSRGCSYCYCLGLVTCCDVLSASAYVYPPTAYYCLGLVTCCDVLSATSRSPWLACPRALWHDSSWARSPASSLSRACSDSLVACVSREGGEGEGEGEARSPTCLTVPREAAAVVQVRDCGNLSSPPTPLGLPPLAPLLTGISPSLPTSAHLCLPPHPIPLCPQLCQPGLQAGYLLLQTLQVHAGRQGSRPGAEYMQGGRVAGQAGAECMTPHPTHIHPAQHQSGHATGQ